MTILTNRVISIYDRRTTMRLARTEWEVLQNICYLEKMKRKTLLELIDQNRDKKIGLTPAVRLFELIYLHTLTEKTALLQRLPNDHKNLHKTLDLLKL